MFEMVIFEWFRVYFARMLLCYIPLLLYIWGICQTRLWHSIAYMSLHLLPNFQKLHDLLYIRSFLLYKRYITFLSPEEQLEWLR
jgi:hypothetical protein